MACATSPSTISNGYYVGAKTSYSNGDEVYYICDQNYVISGIRTVTCSSGVWTGGYPSCSLSFVSNVYFWVTGALVLILVIILLSMLCVVCCKYCGRRSNRVCDDDSEGTIGCCRCYKSRDQVENVHNRSSTKSSNKKGVSHSNVQKPKGQSRTSHNKTISPLKKTLSNSKGINVKKRKVNIRKFKVPQTTPDKAKKEEMQRNTNDKQESDLSARKVAIAVDAWKPFSNPIRNINTSTK